MDELQSSLDASAADDLRELVDGAVLDRVAEPARTVNRVTTELTRTVRHGELTGPPNATG